MNPDIEAPNIPMIIAFEQLLNIQEDIVAGGVEINLNIIQTFIAMSEQLCLVIRNEIQNGNIQNDHIPVYSNFIIRYITMFEGIVQNSNLTDEQKNRFRVPIENLRSTLNLLESHQNTDNNIGEIVPLQGGKKITRNKKSRKGKKSRRKNRKSRRKYRKI